MTTEKWRLIRPTPIPLDWLRPSQDGVYIDGVKNALAGLPSHCGDTYIHVVYHRGVYWISDGHHRYVRDLVQGKDVIMARVLYSAESGAVEAHPVTDH